MKRDTRWLVDNYGPFVAIGLVLVLLLVLAPSKADQQVNEFATTDGGSSFSGTSSGATSAGGAASPSGSATRPGAAGGAVSSAGGAAGGGGATGGAGGGGSTGGGGATAAPGDPGAAPGEAPALQIPQGNGLGQVVGEDCSRRDILGPAIPCKPVWEGPNGGATYQGVTEDEILVLYYIGKPIELVDQSLRAAGYADSEAEAEESRRVAEEWFNANWQTYGRRVRIEFFRSNADGADAAANRAEAVEIAQELGAFAVVATVMNNLDFMDELSRQGVLCVGCGLNLPGSFYTEREPFIYSLLPDGNTQNAHIAEYIAKRLGPTADFAGIGVQGQPRRFGVFYPQDLYAENYDDLQARLADLGIPVAHAVAYASDINTATQQATNAIAQMRQNGVTTVLCLCDPVAPLFLTRAATVQQYYPEWLQTGYYGQDLDLAARFYDQEQWRHNFGPASIPVLGPPEDSVPARVWRQQYPDGRLPSTIGGFWAPFSLLFAVLEGTGPLVDPGTFRDSIFANINIENTSKFVPAIDYGPGDYAGIEDSQEVWWDPEGTGPDGQLGTYRGVNDYRRHRLGQWPTGATQAFDGSCSGPGTCGNQAGPG